MNEPTVECQNVYVEKAAKNTDRLMALGALSTLNTDPPTPFYFSQLVRATVTHLPRETMREALVDLRRIEMLKEVATLAQKVVYQCVPTPAWTTVDTLVEESGIVVPEITLDLSETMRPHNKAGKRRFRA